MNLSLPSKTNNILREKKQWFFSLGRMAGFFHTWMEIIACLTPSSKNNFMNYLHITNRRLIFAGDDSEAIIFKKFPDISTSSSSFGSLIRVFANVLPLKTFYYPQQSQFSRFNIYRSLFHRLDTYKFSSFSIYIHQHDIIHQGVIINNRQLSNWPYSFSNCGQVTILSDNLWSWVHRHR